MELEVRTKEQLVEELKIRNRILEIFFNCPGDEIYDEIMQFILPVFDSKHGVFGYFSGDGLFVVRSITRDVSGELVQVRDKEITFKPAELNGIRGQAMERQKILFANNGNFPLPQEHIPIFNALVAPVVYHERLISAFFLGNKQGGYTCDDKNLMEMIVQQLAPVLHARMQRERELEEKEMLLREVYHRTKNNMQIIASMLRLQAEHAGDENIRQTIKTIENRIQAMLLVHRKLYQSRDLSRVNLREYLHELAHLLMRGYKKSSQRVVLHLDIEDIEVSIDVAIPCGLMVNELMSNALKHAFPGDKRGEIRIRLSRSRNRDIELVVADNGIGVPRGFNFEDQDSLGIKTVLTIARHQLQGSVTFESRGGVTCFVSFSDNNREQENDYTKNNIEDKP